MSNERLDRIEKKLDLILSLLQNDETPSSSSTVKNASKSRKSAGARSTVKKIVIKQGNCKLDVFKDALLITGNTYDRKDLIKGFSARWNSEFKGWTIDSSKLDLVRPQLEKYFESVVFSDTNKYKCLLAVEKPSKYDIADYVIFSNAFRNLNYPKESTNMWSSGFLFLMYLIQIKKVKKIYLVGFTFHGKVNNKRHAFLWEHEYFIKYIKN